MCLFYGEEEECNHAECQIVNTIKQLNTNSLFRQSHHHMILEKPSSQHPSGVHPEPILKMEPNEGSPWEEEEETDKQKIIRLEA